MSSRSTLAIIATVALLLAGALIPSSGAEDGDEGTVAVLFDFGDGRWAWNDVGVPDPANAWCATMNAADTLDFDLDYSFSQFGVFLESVDGVDTPEDFSAYWGLWDWEGDGGVWGSSMVGALDLEVPVGSSIAWRFGAFGEPGPDANPVTRDPWLSFRGGKDVQGVSAPPRLPAAAEFWSRDMDNGPIDSTLAVADGKVFGISGGIFDWNLFEFTQLPAVFALDAKGGDLLWSYEFRGSGGFEIGSPAYHNGMVFATLSNRSVIALDADTGDLVWQTEVDDEGLSSSPTVAAGRVITGTGSGKLVALHTSDGSVNWTTNISGWVYLAQPTVHEGIVYIGTDNGSLHAVSLEDGTELWASELGGRLRGTPLVHGGSIYLIKGIYDGFIPKDGFLLALDMDGNELWEVNIGTTGSSPAVIDDTVVVGSTGGLRAFSTDGTPEWSFTEGGPVSSSPVITADRIQFMTNVNDSDEGLHTSIFSLGSNGYEDWRKELRPHNWALSSVAIADYRIYAATDAGWVYSLGDTQFHADYEWTADGGHVSLNDTSVSFGAELVGWRWQNSEFEELRDQNVTVQFNASGIYPVTLLVYDEFGRKVRVTKNVTVELPPLVAGSTYVVDGTMVTFTANYTDTDMIVTGYRWDIEGVAEPLVGKEVTHEFAKGGNFDVTLTVTDEYDRSDAETQTVKIKEESTGEEGAFGGSIEILFLIGIILIIAIIVIVIPARNKGKERGDS